jgi:hypothetical protein
MSYAKLRCRNRNSGSEIEIRIEIPMSTWYFDEIRMKCIVWISIFQKKNYRNWNRDQKFRFRHLNRNRNFGKSKHRNFDEIRIPFCRNFDFDESKKYFRGNPTQALLTCSQCSTQRLNFESRWKTEAYCVSFARFQSQAGSLWPTNVSVIKFLLNHKNTRK